MSDFAQAVRDGLSRPAKQLPCRFFYDHAGSMLFEDICEVPEYYIPNAEVEILTTHANAIGRMCHSDAEIVELGSGSASKTKHLIDALLNHRTHLRYVPIDISKTALEMCQASLERAYPTLTVSGIQAEYEEGLRLLSQRDPTPRLILWLGSNIGNMHRPDAGDFVARLGQHMGRDDRLLLGIDLRKGPDIIEAAYNDQAGVTERFNKNILDRINREFSGNFDVAQFQHRAIYNEPVGRIEMCLVSTRAQTVRIDALDLEISFAAGESTHTENSYKYSWDEIDALADAAQLTIVGRWTDSREYFAEVLLEPN